MDTLEESRLIGRGNEKSEIIKLLSDKKVQQFRVISVWGMGGIGKTTLVRDIYRSEEISGTFRERACVTIMRPFNCDELLKSLTLQFGHKDATTDLTNYLSGKRYLIILDDVLSTSEWDTIIQRLPKATKSCIIVTTREKNIAKHCSEDERNMYELSSLNNEYARILFTKKVQIQ
jgi:predicted AAA+ superfamily ATPase